VGCHFFLQGILSTTWMNHEGIMLTHNKTNTVKYTYIKASKMAQW